MSDLRPVIVVEGKTDVQFLSSFVKADFVEVNGSAISRETISYISALAKKRKVIVLTDPDGPGRRIRKVLDEAIPGLAHAFVPKEKCVRGKKVGIAESDKESVLIALRNIVPGEVVPSSDLDEASLFRLGLVGGPDSARLRKELGERLHIGEANGRSFLKRCKALGLTEDDLRRALDGR